MKTDETLNLENTPEEASSASVVAPIEVTGAMSQPAPVPAVRGVNGSIAEEDQAGFMDGASDVEEQSAGEEVGTEENAKARPRSIIRELVETVAIVVVVFVTVRFLIQNFVVEGDSMLPSLHSEQYLLVNKAAYYQYDSNFFGRLFNSSSPSQMHYLFGGPSRGDVVVFLAPTESKDFIKRVIGLPGETVEIKADPDPTGQPGSPCGDCGVYINGVRLNEPYIKQTPDYAYGPVTIDEGFVFVMGDNRRNSQDSHSFGPLKVNAIIGTAFVSYWPFDKLGFLSHPTYEATAATQTATPTQP